MKAKVQKPKTESKTNNEFFVSENDLVDKLESSRPGAAMVVLVTRTEPELTKKHRVTKEPCPYQYGIYRISRRSAVLGADYETKVNRNNFRDAVKIAEEHGVDTTRQDKIDKIVEQVPEFKAEQLWRGKGKHVSRFTVEHCDTHERYFYFLPSTKKGDNGTATVYEDEYRENVTDRVIDGVELEDLKVGYLPKVSVAESGQTWRTVKLSNVLIVAHAGNVYQVQHAKVETKVEAEIPQIEA